MEYIIFGIGTVLTGLGVASIISYVLVAWVQQGRKLTSRFAPPAIFQALAIGVGLALIRYSL